MSLFHLCQGRVTWKVPAKAACVESSTCMMIHDTYKYKYQYNNLCIYIYEYSTPIRKIEKVDTPNVGAIDFHPPN